MAEARAESTDIPQMNVGHDLQKNPPDSPHDGMTLDTSQPSMISRSIKSRQVLDNALRQSLPLGLLKKEIMNITAGRKIAYVVDCSFTEPNVEKIARLSKDADILFIEAMFLDSDAALAQARHHLTARQAGTIARLAQAKRILGYRPSKSLANYG
jgi:ribonuclease BN (tRNA processing enzyme)